MAEDEHCYPELNQHIGKCMECQLAKLQTENARLRKALEEIANMDYRGNRSMEMQIAYRALKE